MTTRTHSAVRKNGNGRVIRLNKEARQLVEANANGIVNALLDATKLGHVMSARLLIELAEAGVAIEEVLTKRPLSTLAMRLAKEPQMSGTSSNKGAQTEAEKTELVTA